MRSTAIDGVEQLWRPKLQNIGPHEVCTRSGIDGRSVLGQAVGFPYALRSFAALPSAMLCYGVAVVAYTAVQKRGGRPGSSSYS